MQVAEVKRLLKLEAENARLKRPEIPTTAKPGESCVPVIFYRVRLPEAHGVSPFERHRRREFSIYAEPIVIIDDSCVRQSVIWVERDAA